VRVVDVDYDDPVHVRGVVELLDSYATDPVGGGRPLPPDVRRRLLPALRSHPTSRVLLAVADGEPVGIAVCFVGLSTFSAKRLLNIHDLAVLPAWRGRGVGRALLSAAEERACAEDCCKLTLEVQDDNARARGLYESFGFSDFVVGSDSPTRFLTKSLEG
jgi:ribosomal protein S18 acetylase RimI-like enzyme